MTGVTQILRPETELEIAITLDREFIEGCFYGKPRLGHPEGLVIYHIRDVLGNVDRYCDAASRRDLRLAALVHDTFKYQVDRTKPKVGENNHGFLARKFAGRHISAKPVLEVIELHDEAYNSWFQGHRKNEWAKAEQRARRLAERLQGSDALDLYLAFYKCDNETGDKDKSPFAWFLGVMGKG